MPAQRARARVRLSHITSELRVRGTPNDFVSGSTVELTVPGAGAPPPAPVAASRARFSGARLYFVMAGAGLVIGALSLLIPSTPSYDPWAWLVWGREIVHLDLHTTGGPTWKPLTVIFTTLFAPFGRSAPDLWLVVARAGAVVAVAMVFKLCLRLTTDICGWPRAGASGSQRALAYAPGVLAGIVAGIGLVFAGGYINSEALGYSEGLLTALVLIAIERHLDGHHRQAFVIAFFAALDRPETWLFWGPYGLWLWRKDPGARKLVIGLFALIPVLWFLPEYWGSGHFFRGVQRANNPRSNSAAHASFPFWAELRKHAWPTVPSRIKLVAIVGIALSLLTLRRANRSRGVTRLWALRLVGNRERALGAMAIYGVLGFAWWILISIMTQAGFSGNDRYLVLGASMIEVAGGVTFGWAAYELGRALPRWLPAARRMDSQVSGWSALALVAIVFAFVPSWIGGLVRIQRTHRALVYQALLRTDAATAVAQLGGGAKIMSCGSVMTEGFQVPMLAWQLGVHTIDVEASPLTKPTAPDGGPLPGPAVVFRVRAQRNAHMLPILSDWPTTHYRLVTATRTFRVYVRDGCNVGHVA